MKPITINWHMTQKCNYACKFCFAEYGNPHLPEIHKDIAEAIWLLKELKGFFNSLEYTPIKLTLTGGEPFLCKNLGIIVKYAKRIGYIVSIITNGSIVSNRWLKRYGKYLDWLGLSLDSPYNETEKMLGRTSNNINHVDIVRKLVTRVRKHAPNVKIKINTVVTKLNYQEDLKPIISEIKPDKWKVFQVVIRNDLKNIDKSLAITKEEFQEFVERHKELKPIVEEVEDTRTSYIMVDPYGRFYYRNERDEYIYSDPILEVGAEKAFDQIKFNYRKFIDRGGAKDFISNKKHINLSQFKLKITGKRG